MLRGEWKNDLSGPWRGYTKPPIILHVTDENEEPSVDVSSQCFGEGSIVNDASVSSFQELAPLTEVAVFVKTDGCPNGCNFTNLVVSRWSCILQVKTWMRLRGTVIITYNIAYYDDLQQAHSNLTEETCGLWLVHIQVIFIMWFSF